MAIPYNPMAYGMKAPRKVDFEIAIAQTVGVPPERLNFVELTDNSEQSWRHSCVPSGVTVLSKRMINFAGFPVTFAYCAKCGRVMYYKDRGTL